ncbi:MAG: hypothetical protein IPQ01_17665 [Zoogloea sp.]|nr:hypothetical protein [Zoogloea sp.]
MPTRGDRHLRAMQLAKQLAALGARLKTIHLITGIPPRQVQSLFFPDAHTIPRGRAPDSADAALPHQPGPGLSTSSPISTASGWPTHRRCPVLTCPSVAASSSPRSAPWRTGEPWPSASCWNAFTGPSHPSVLPGSPALDMTERQLHARAASQAEPRKAITCRNK